MKRLLSPGVGVLLVAWLAGTSGQATAAVATCGPGEPRAIIQGSDPRTEADFVASNGTWVRNTIQLSPQQGAQGSKPARSNGGQYAWSQTGGTAVTLVPGTDNQGDLFVRFQAPDVTAQTALTFRLEVSCLAANGALQTASDTVTVNITNAYSSNLAPDASASASPALVQDGQTVQLLGSGTDPNGDTLTYHWTQEDGPAVVLADPNAAVTSFVAPNTAGSAGATLKFRLTVSDGALSDAAETTVSVSWVNDPPVAQLACPLSLLELDEGEAFTLDGSASHDYEDGIGLGYAWSGGPWATATSGWDGAAVLPLGNFDSSTINLTAPQLGYQQVGKFTYRLTVTDTGGLYTFSDCDVFVRDVTGPSISVPADITAEATSPAGANVGTDEGYMVSASDLVDGPLPLVNATAYFVCEPAPGALFALDATTPVLCSAKDSAGNSAEAGFDVTVVDTTPPTVTTPLSQAAEATGASGAVVTFAASSDDIVDGTQQADCTPASGSTFPLGDTTVTCGATDAHGNVATPASFTVSVLDTTPPALGGMPGDQLLEATSAAGASFTYAPTAVDLVAGAVPVSCVPASGTTFGLDATTTVTCSAADAFDNTARASFTVTVRDTTGPTIAPHADVYAFATGNSQAVVNYDLPTASDLVDGPVTVTCLPASGSTFTAGTTQVTCTAQDSRGNAATPVHFYVEVGYDWRGFFAPVDNPATVNTVKAGSAIPVKFNLGGNQGLAIFAANSPASGPIACSATDGDAVEETVTAGSSSLQFDASTGQYIYVWKTEKAWVGQCRVLQVKLRDGQVKSALFKFK
jgi:hypothetical protein